MEKHIEATSATKRVRFSVPIDLRQFSELLRHLQLGDRRTLGDWVEDGLRLALAETTKMVRPAVSVEEPKVGPTVKSDIKRAFEALEAMRLEDDLREKRLGVKPRPGSYRGA